MKGDTRNHAYTLFVNPPETPLEAKVLKEFTSCRRLPGLHADLFSRHSSPLDVYAVVAVTIWGEDVMSDEIWSSIQRKATIKEAE